MWSVQLAIQLSKNYSHKSTKEKKSKTILNDSTTYQFLLDTSVVLFLCVCVCVCVCVLAHSVLRYSWCVCVCV